MKINAVSEVRWWAHESNTRNVWNILFRKYRNMREEWLLCWTKTWAKLSKKISRYWIAEKPLDINIIQTYPRTLTSSDEDKVCLTKMIREKMGSEHLTVSSLGYLKIYISKNFKMFTAFLYQSLYYNFFFFQQVMR